MPVSSMQELRKRCSSLGISFPEVNRPYHARIIRPASEENRIVIREQILKQQKRELIMARRIERIQLLYKAGKNKDQIKKMLNETQHMITKAVSNL